MKRSFGEKIGYAFALVCIVGGFVGLPWALGYAADALASASWPTTPGRVLEREVVQTDNQVWERQQSHQPRVRYTYTVDGQPYESTQLAFDFNAQYQIRSEAMDQISPYLLDLPVDVFYEPGNPANAVLRPGSDWRSYRPLVFAIAPVVLGIVIIVYRRIAEMRREAAAQEKAEQRRAKAAARRAADR